jgi:mono/diheme cytochrome c family protein
MSVWRNTLIALVCAPVFCANSAGAQQGDAAPGKALVASKCFQCHTDAMFRDGRQNRRGWEATIYRMVGRGALWTPDEIKQMADYLGDALGPDVKPIETAK